MSKSRIPSGCRKVLLTLFYADGFCTCQAIWDDAEIERQIEGDMCIIAATHEGTTYYVKRTVNSNPIGIMLTKQIIERWVNGEYVTVKSGMRGGAKGKDWMS